MQLDIVMPFYGDPTLFQQSVESVRAQRGTGWRLTIVDDVYPSEEPRRWVDSLGDDRIRYLRNETNLGVNGNFRRSIEVAEAPLVTVMGCDDLMLPGFAERAIAVMSEFPDADYVQPGVQTIDAHGAISRPLADRVKSRYRPRTEVPLLLAGEEAARGLIRGNWTYFPSITWRTDTIRQHDFRANMEVALDLILQLDILVGGGSFVVDPVETFQYRRHSGSVSSWRAVDGSRFVEEARVFDDVATEMAAHGWPRAARAARLRLTSRLNALSSIPGALGGRDWAGIAALTRHALR